MTAILPPYTAMINDYLRRTLGYETDVPYYVFNPGELWSNWSYGDASKGHPDTSESFRGALSKNPHMRVLVASGYYDLATPYFEGVYELEHLPIPDSLRKNITYRYFPSGHMVYLNEASLKGLHDTVADFVNTTSH